MVDPQAALDALAAAQAEVEALEASALNDLLAAKQAYLENPTPENYAAKSAAAEAMTAVRRAIRGERSVALAGDTFVSGQEG